MKEERLSALWTRYWCIISHPSSDQSDVESVWMVCLLDPSLQVRKVWISVKMNPTLTILIRALKLWFVSTVVIRMRCHSCILVDAFWTDSCVPTFSPDFCIACVHFHKRKHCHYRASDLIDVWRLDRIGIVVAVMPVIRWCLSSVIIGHLRRSRRVSISSIWSRVMRIPCSSFPSLWSSYSCSNLPMKQQLVRYIRMWLIITVVQFWKTVEREILQSFTSAILVVYNLSDQITACKNSSRLTKWTRFTSQF